MKHCEIIQIINSQEDNNTDIKSYILVSFTFFDCMFKSFTDPAAAEQFNEMKFR